MFKWILTVFNFPDIDPIIISFGSPYFAIRWYSLAYIFAFITGYLILKKLSKEFSTLNIDKKMLSDYVLWGAMGIIIGGRIGEILFYNIHYYLENPFKIFYVWEGGMSFHGGLIGIITATYIFTKRYKINFVTFMDAIAVPAPLGLFYGRIANFINQELFGAPAEKGIGVIFPKAPTIEGINMPRHPTQLYEALAEGLILFIILFTLSRYEKFRNRTGFLSGMFLTFYGFFRIAIEPLKAFVLFKRYDVFGFNLTLGQIYCIPMIVFGLYLIYKSKPKKVKKNKKKI